MRCDWKNNVALEGAFHVCEYTEVSVRQLRNIRRRYCEEVKHFSPRRQREFIFGRALCDRAMSRWGYSEFQLGVSRSGMPLWPDELVGSISHDEDCYLVAVASKADVRYVGVDVHYLLPYEQMSRILSKFETEAFQCIQQRLAPCDLSKYQMVNLLWSAKEAAYKSLPESAQSGSLQDFVVRDADVATNSSFDFFIRLTLAELELERTVMARFYRGFVVCVCIGCDNKRMS
tara:strand:+ start:3664 stop:4356 length:693 start_codon:yes stop_codon:yes gene_type:complete